MANIMRVGGGISEEEVNELIGSNISRLPGVSNGNLIPGKVYVFFSLHTDSEGTPLAQYSISNCTVLKSITAAHNYWSYKATASMQFFKATGSSITITPGSRWTSGDTASIYGPFDISF